MPVSGQEETGVKSIAGQFSDFIAGVPIKKRRFPLFRPSSPLSEDSSIPEENELLRKELSSTSQGSTLSNATIAGAPIKKRRFPLIQASSSSFEEPCSLPEENDALRKEHSSTSQGSTLSTSSSGLSESNRNPVFEEGKASSEVTNANKVQSNSNFLIPKLEEPDLATPSCTLDVMESKEKVALKEAYGEKLVSQMIKGKSELLLAAKEGLALNIGADINKQNVQEKCKQECPVVPESTDLSLGLKEHLFPALSSQDIDESCQKKEKTESVSLKLSLSEEMGTTQRNGDVKSDSDRAHVHSNRANWDLNTTMDAWEESVTDAASGKTSTDVLKSTDPALDEKHFMCSTGIPTTGVASVKKTHVESKNRAFAISSTLYGQQYKSGDPCNLRLSSSCLQKYAEEPSRLSVKLNSGSVIPTVNSSSVVASGGDLSMDSFRTVKSEPFDENPKQNLKKVNLSPVGSLDSVAVKHELVERFNVEAFNSSKGGNLRLVDPKFVKSEPGHEGNQERPKTTEVKSDQVGTGLLQGLDNCSSAVSMPTTMETTPISAETECLVEKPTCSADLSTSGNVVNHLENSHVDEKESLGACPIAEQVPIETVAIAMVDNGTESSVPDMKDDLRADGENADDPEGCRLKLMNELPPPDPRGSGEGCVSDDEKITLSADMLDDDSYGSDYESDDNHALTVAMDTEQYGEDDDYEDGEVREPLKHSSAEDTICEVREVERVDCISYENKQLESGGLVSGDCPTSSHVEEGENKTVNLSQVNSGKDGVDTEINEKYDKVTEKNVCLQESLDAEKPTVGSDGKKPVKVLRRKLSDISEMKIVPKSSESELFSDEATNGSRGVDVAQYTDEVVKTTDVVRKTDLDLQKIEASANFDDATKDINNGANQGRIINLSRAASASSPSKTRSMSGRSLPSRAGREILSDALDGDKIIRGRDEIYIDGPRKFSRERNQDLSPRNTRLSFGRGRGRGSRLDTLRGDWESDREFTGEFYNGPSQFRGPRHKYASTFTDADLEYNNIAPDSSFVGTGRVGRKPLNDEGPLCRHIPSRRRSPGGRDVATGRSIQMGHRIPRNMSPSRCIGGGDGSELVGMRHGDKFMRGFPEDPIDPMFSRPQPFEGLEGRYTRGGRSSFMQRRGLPRIRSKSPIRSRSRSPGPWTSPRRRSPRRRSPDGFGGHPEMTHRRSPLYRTDRMRSPDRPVFPGERVVRRHGSPSYMSRPPNDIRDMESGRDHVHPRSVMSNRSPSGRILLRNRRFDVVDRGDNEEYFGGPMHSGGRILELNGEGNGDERRRFGERRGPVRSFRPPYNGNVGENFHLNAEDGPRHYRFCADDDSEFHERNLRERDFDRRIKTRPANVPPRRTRNIDEQEANYRHGGGQVWTDEGFDDISRVKRKRF